MQTGFSGILIGWISSQTTFVPLWDRMEGAWLRTLYRRLGADSDIILKGGPSTFILHISGLLYTYVQHLHVL
jgi:hypothetical protein